MVTPHHSTITPASRALTLLFLILAAMIAVGCSKTATKKKVVKKDAEQAEELAAVDPNPEPAALEEVIETPAEPEPEPEPELEVDETSIISVLGYHDFTKSRKPDEMLMREDKFRKQMQLLKDANIKVVSLDDVVAWRRKERDLPKRCVVITADDGWREVHTYMMPILKEFEYPFTVYLYTNFLDGGGRSLSQAQVEDIMAAGGTIASHSISHRDMNRVKIGKENVSFGRFDRLRTAFNKGLEELDKGADIVTVEGVKRSRATVEAKLKELADSLAKYDEWIIEELKVSKDILEEKFKVQVKSFAFPYGPYNDRIVMHAMELGYETLVTVNGAKTNFETPLGEIPRFIIHGGDDRNWNLATSFKGSGGLEGDGNLLNPRAAEGGDADPEAPKEKLVKVTPAEGELIADRQPTIEFDFSKLEGVEPTSLEMRVGGFGEVPATLDSEKKIFSWKVPRKLRNDTCSVQVTLRQAGKQRRVAWSFSIDKLVLYTPDYTEKFPAEELPAVPKAIPVALPE